LSGGISSSRCLSYEKYVASSKASSLESTTSASSLNFNYICAPCKSSSSCLRLLPRLLTSSITQPPLQLLPLHRFRGINRPGRQADSHIQLLLRLRMSGAVLRLPRQPHGRHRDKFTFNKENGCVLFRCPEISCFQSTLRSKFLVRLKTKPYLISETLRH
jgi:hypothetical protein